jgi:hypothetical protein
VNLPVADAFQPGEPLFCRFERSFRCARRTDHDRALTTPKKPIVSRDLVEEANAIAGHRAVLSCNDDVSILRGRSRTHDLNQSHWLCDALSVSLASLPFQAFVHPLLYRQNDSRKPQPRESVGTVGSSKAIAVSDRRDMLADANNRADRWSMFDHDYAKKGLSLARRCKAGLDHQMILDSGDARC